MKWRKGPGKLSPPAGHLFTFNMWCAGVKGSHKNLQLADVASSYYSCVEAAQGNVNVSLPLGRTRSDTHQELSHGGMRRKSTGGRGPVGSVLQGEARENGQCVGERREEQRRTMRSWCFTVLLQLMDRALKKLRRDLGQELFMELQCRKG